MHDILVILSGTFARLINHKLSEESLQKLKNKEVQS